MRSTELKYFIEVAECLSLTRASERLGISQPSLSMSIKRLENEVDVQLLNRHKTGVTLTVGGQRLLKHAKQLLQLWSDVKQSIYDSHHKIEGQLTFGCHSLVAMYHIPTSLPSLLKAHPKLSLNIVNGLSREINEAIISGKIDMGIVVNPIRHPDLIIIKLRDDKIGFWHHKEYALANKEEATLLCDPNLTQSEVLIKKYKKNGGSFGRFIESQNLELIAKLATQKVGIAILPESIALAQADNALIQIKPNLFYPDEICLVYRHENRFIQAVQAIKTCLTAVS